MTAAADSWTVVHVGSGLVLGVLGVPAVLTIAALVGFEVVEAFLRREGGRGALFASETPGNVFVDVLAGLVGYAAGRVLR